MKLKAFRGRHFFKKTEEVYSYPGLPDGLFSDQKNNLGIFWRALEWKMFAYFVEYS
jgi:hypothetical protein